MKRTLILVSVLSAAGCGDYDMSTLEEKPESKEEGTADEGEDDAGSSEEPKDPVENVLNESPDNGPIAVTYGPNVKLENVAEIFSATKIIGTLYFTGKDAQGNFIVGTMRPDETKAEIIPVARMNANNIELAGKYLIPTNADDNLYLMNDDEIIAVDLVSMEAVGRVASECAIESQFTFSRDGRWNMIWNSKMDVCGMVDGATIESRVDIVDGYTGGTLAFDNYSRFSFDGVQLFRYQFEHKLLSVYSSEFAYEKTFSTSNYLYNSAETSFVSDNNGNRWFFSCTEEKACFRTQAYLVTQ